MRKCVLILGLLGFCLGQDCDDGYTEIDGECYYQGDLDVLQIFINNSDFTLNMDMDVDSSGVIEPLEFGVQVWVNGRMTALQCESPNFGVACEISGEIPSEIGNLSNLESLDFKFNQIYRRNPS